MVEQSGVELFLLFTHFATLFGKEEREREGKRERERENDGRTDGRTIEKTAEAAAAASKRGESDHGT
jgi:hypothetical protein